jgi:hypothetical protein
VYSASSTDGCSEYVLGNERDVGGASASYAGRVDERHLQHIAAFCIESTFASLQVPKITDVIILHLGVRPLLRTRCQRRKFPGGRSLLQWKGPFPRQGVEAGKILSFHSIHANSTTHSPATTAGDDIHVSGIPQSTFYT